MQETEITPLRDLPDWALVPRSRILELLSIGESAFYQMIQHNLVPDGKTVLGRTKMWRLAQVRDMAERLYSGEFEGVNIWESWKKTKKIKEGEIKL